MNDKLILIGRTAVAGLLLTIALVGLGAGVSGATETKYWSTQPTFQYQPTYTDLATARIARVGITPIPIP